MRVLLDTHTFIWFIGGSANLSDTARRLIEDVGNERLLSVASRGLLRGQQGDSYRMIVDNWPFPLFSVDLGLVNVDQDDLREIQQRWIPDW